MILKIYLFHTKSGSCLSTDHFSFIYPPLGYKFSKFLYFIRISQNNTQNIFFPHITYPLCIFLHFLAIHSIYLLFVSNRHVQYKKKNLALISPKKNSGILFPRPKISNIKFSLFHNLIRRLYIVEKKK